MPTKQAVEHPPVSPMRHATGPRSTAPVTSEEEEESVDASPAEPDPMDEYDAVDRAGMDSFPASDPPPFSPGHD